MNKKQELQTLLKFCIGGSSYAHYYRDLLKSLKSSHIRKIIFDGYSSKYHSGICGTITASLANNYELSFTLLTGIPYLIIPTPAEYATGTTFNYARSHKLRITEAMDLKKVGILMTKGPTINDEKLKEVRKYLTGKMNKNREELFYFTCGGI